MLTNNQKSIILKTWIGKNIEVLCEGKRDNYLFGYSSQYLPVHILDSNDLINRIIHCKVIDVKDEFLIAERVNNHETKSII